LAAINEVRGWLAAARAVTVLTGAGVSTDSGIPDFRGPQGVWTRNPGAERTATLQTYLADPEVRRMAWRSRLDSPAWDARPNLVHRALVDLERTGQLVGLVTQNTDGLHQRAGSDPGLVIEVHGTMWWSMCWTCTERLPMAETLDRVRAGEPDPACLCCGGILKSATVSFGQALDRDVIARAEAAAHQAEVFVVLGTTLTVNPVAGLVPLAKLSGARVVIVNAEPTAHDDLADVIMRGSLADIVPTLIELPASGNAD
jgi:NAD-dependent deacetylase